MISSPLKMIFPRTFTNMNSQQRTYHLSNYYNLRLLFKVSYQVKQVPYQLQQVLEYKEYAVFLKFRRMRKCKKNRQSKGCQNERQKKQKNIIHSDINSMNEYRCLCKSVNGCDSQEVVQRRVIGKKDKSLLIS